MKKRIKHKAVGRAPQARQSVPDVVPEKTETQSEKSQVQSEKPQEIRFPLGAEYILQQYYDIIVDERFIEEKWASTFTERDEYVEEGVARFKRMLRAIVADQKVLREVFDWLILVEQDSMNGGNYVYEYYEKDREFLDILMDRIDLFDSEDKAWLLRLWSHKGEEDFDLYLQVEGLRDAFHLVPSGFRVGQHACKLVENDKEPIVSQT